ncbi:hypothetical protein [Sorangium sp. So ce426]|uniref:hypothetical protein n=1 Tax=unclassified Sorangium TaxID=2621164 RepID=UPI003F5C9E23
MRVIMEILEGAFRTPKIPEQVAEEIRHAAAAFSAAHGDVAPAVVSEIIAPSPAREGAALMDILLSMPEVGEGADFERPGAYRRPVAELD